MTRLVLGSSSSGRLKVLRQAGVDPLVVVSGVDEDAVIAGLGSDADPDEVVRALARAKAEHVTTLLSGAYPDVAANCLVVGCDSMLYLDGGLCGKPASVDDARRQWRSMAGHIGELHTGHCLILLQDNVIASQVAETTVTRVHFGIPSDADLEAYLASGESLGVAGGFTLDGLSGWFIDGVEGDPSNVIGLSLPLIRTLAQRMDVSVAALWAANAVAS